MTPGAPAERDKVIHRKEVSEVHPESEKGNPSFRQAKSGGNVFLAEEEQITEGTQRHNRRDQPGKAFRIEEGLGRFREQRGHTMPAAMIDDRKGITAGWAFFQWHASHIAGFGAIARPACATSARQKTRRTRTASRRQLHKVGTTSATLPNFLLLHSSFSLFQPFAAAIRHPRALRPRHDFSVSAFSPSEYLWRMKPEVLLRDIEPDDLPIFFEHQRDPVAVAMVVFRSRDKAEFDEHWAKILADDTGLKKTIGADGQIAGHIASFGRDGNARSATGSTAHLGACHYEQALPAFLHLEQQRPLYAGVAPHNIASIRVLQKRGFTLCESPTDQEPELASESHILLKLGETG
jgi:RimJ/RimL family protein N-acetyltransferase